MSQFPYLLGQEEVRGSEVKKGRGESLKVREALRHFIYKLAVGIVEDKTLKFSRL